MKRFFIIIAVVFFCNCSKQPSLQTQKLNGYWEIEQVTLPDGSVKAYTFNNTIDFIELIDSTKGIRKKLKPNLDGSFEGSNLEETFEIKTEGDSINLYYKTPYSEWKETVLKLNDDQLETINHRNIIYTYKHYEPLNLDL